MKMDPMFLAMSLCRRRKFEQCAEICTEILSKNPYDQVNIIIIVIVVVIVIIITLEQIPQSV